MSNSGAPSDPAVTTDIPATMTSLLRGAVIALVAGLPAALGRLAATASASVALATEDFALLTNLAGDARQDASVAPVQISIADGTSTQSAALTAGLYLITADLDVAFIAAANPTATSASRKLWEKTYRWCYVATASDKVAAIRLGSDTGTVSIEKVA